LLVDPFSEDFCRVSLWDTFVKLGILVRPNAVKL
jgi:hypothetical protein